MAGGGGSLHGSRGGAAGGRGCSRRTTSGGVRTAGWRYMLSSCCLGGKIATPAAGCYLRAWVEGGCRAGGARSTAGG